MRPLQLKLQAFSSYGKAVTIDFTKPNQELFLVSGNTGSGKSSIFDALVFALYGEASSGANKKSGSELQSQYAPLSLEPFAELRFSERRGEREEIYTVHRVPRHIRPLKRGQGFKEESGRVSLLLPDGSEYPEKEADRKLVELVGLSKTQFMQVAMIAQGEFMELLRARSEEKKLIFRKLFGTELYQRLTDELLGRLREKERGLAALCTESRTELSHLLVPEGGSWQRLLELQKRLLSEDGLSAALMDDFLRGLEELLSSLEEENREILSRYESCSRERNEKRDRYKEGEALARAFTELSDAEKELSELKGLDPEFSEKELLSRKIRFSYEISSLFLRLRDSEKRLSLLREQETREREALPGFLERERAEEAEHERRKLAFEEATRDYAKIKERAEEAIESFQRRKRAEKRFLLAEDALRKTEKNLLELAEKRAGLSGKKEEAERELRELSDLGVRQERWKGEWKEAEQREEELQALERALRELSLQEKRAKELRERYDRLCGEVRKRNKFYQEAREAFLDAQAGILAREKLRPGSPCPVCGSLDHPSPCRIPKEKRIPGREELEKLRESVFLLQKEQEELSGEAGASEKLREEKARAYSGAVEEFRGRISAEEGSMEREEELSAFSSKLLLGRERLEKERERLRKEGERAASLEEGIKKLSEILEKAAEEEEKAESELLSRKEELSAAKAERESSLFRKLYPDEEAAKADLKRASEKRKEGQRRLLEQEQRLREMREKRAASESLLSSIRSELPACDAEHKERRAAYDGLLIERKLSEKEWMEVCGAHRREESDALASELNRHAERKAALSGRILAAKKSTEGREKPELSELLREREEAERRFLLLSEKKEKLSMLLLADRALSRALLPRMEEREKLSKEASRLEGLYRRLSGKRSGSRMDIETYVQRYFLRRILRNANLRFREMSLGQYELRMIPEEQAGDGRNRGLDLTVYSYVTGKEREVRTLSGGESFMAALSLAMGMADQIQESSASVHLELMFIDEGFGSLDEHAREQAVRVLRDMSGGGKLLGIISHVSELKQEIEDQLLVTKDAEGSHVRWQIS